MLDARSRPRPSRAVTALRLAGIVLLVAAVFLYRFNTLGGSLGGFDDDHFIALARANQLLDGEWPLRDYPDASLQGAWPPLTYLASAGAQLVLGRSLLAEAVLTTGAVAIAAGLTMAAGISLTGSAWLGAVAALLSVIPSVKLYGYARPLLFAAVLLLAFRYVDRPSTRRLVWLSGALSIAFLVRHDYAVYLAAGVTAALLTTHAAPAARMRRLAICGGLSLALLVPTLIIVHNLVGLDAYVQSARALVQDEAARTNLRWPAFDLMAGWTEENRNAWLYYLFLMLPALGCAAAIWRATRGRAHDAELPKVLALGAGGAVANYFLLRGNLEARLPDPAVFHALIGVWLLQVSWQRRAATPRGVRATTAALATALMAVSAVSLGAVGSMPQEIGTARFKEGPVATLKATGRVWGILRDLPPVEWGPESTHDGSMLAAAYLSRCTPRDARILNATYGTEFIVFARRRFAAGHVNFVPGFYSSPVDQLAAIARARRQVVPVAVTDPADTYEDDFVPDFPLIDEYLRDRYVEAGTIPKNGEPYLRVLVQRNRQPTGTFGHTGLPCFR